MFKDILLIPWSVRIAGAETQPRSQPLPLGVFKDIVLILWSVLLSGAVVVPLQYLGYAIALAGVVVYTRHKHATQACASELSEGSQNREGAPQFKLPPPC